MKILLMSVGTRGDCEPFLGVGELLREKGMEVACAFPEQYSGLAEESGFTFYTLGSEFIDLLDTEAGRIALGGDVKGTKKVLATIEVAKQSKPIQPLLVERQKEICEAYKPDMIIYHPKVMYAIPWSLETGKRAVMLATVPFAIHKLTKADAKHYGKAFNPLLCDVTNFGTAMAIKNIAQKYCKVKLSGKQIKEKLVTGKVFYTFSEYLFKKPSYWGEHTMIAGFMERNKTLNFKPSEELKAFVEKHNKILFVTFGSMTNENPKEKTQTLLEIVEKHKIPTLINISGGGFSPVGDTKSENMMFVNSIPYDWILEKVYATIHHGGAGTLHSSLKAGCATMAIPHAVDQPMWDDMIYKNKLGPKGIHIADFSKGGLEEKICDLYTNPIYKKNAMEISEKMKAEDKQEELYRFITE